MVNLCSKPMPLYYLGSAVISLWQKHTIYLQNSFKTPLLWSKWQSEQFFLFFLKYSPQKNSTKCLFFSPSHARSTSCFSCLFHYSLLNTPTHKQIKTCQLVLPFRVVSEVSSHVSITVKQRGISLFPLSARMEGNQHSHQFQGDFYPVLKDVKSNKQQWLVFKGQLPSKSPIMQSALERIRAWTCKISTQNWEKLLTF